MKKQSLLRGYIAFFACISLALTGCSEDDTYKYNAIDNSENVSLELVNDATASKAIIKFTPGSDVSKIEYAIGQESDREVFKLGTYSGIRTVQGNTVFTVTFAELDAGKEYTVFARTYDEVGKVSPIASLRIKTYTTNFTLTQEYVSDVSVAYRIACPSEFYSCSYAVGRASDKTAFKNGTLKGIQTIDEPLYGYVANFFDLEPETDYVFYCIGRDRNDNPSILFEEPFTTTASTGIPDVEVQIDVLDLYMGTFTVKPNNLCGKIYVTSYGEGSLLETSLLDKYTWHGDFAAVMPSWVDNNYAQTADGGNSATISTTLYDLQLNMGVKLYVTIYDKNNKLSCVKRFEYFTPEYNSNLGKATVELTVVDVTSTSATIFYSADENTLLFFWDIDPKEDLDQVLAGMASGTYDKYYIHNLFISGGYIYNSNYSIYCRLNKQAYATYSGLQPNTEYYVLAAPMNGNGPILGWSDLVYTQFTTSAE